MLLQKLKSGIYTGKIKTYNTRRSTRTGLTYLNLTVTIKANGQKVDFQKSYCLDPGKNIQFITSTNPDLSLSSYYHTQELLYIFHVKNPSHHN